MEKDEFRKRGHELVEWMADFLETKENLPVTPDVNPGDILAQLPMLGPEKGESFDTIFADFKQVILPGMTHWQHPSFFGYFPANNSEPSILAEMLMATIGAQCMSWMTSPAAAELEERVCDWLKEAKGIDSSWKGCIHDTASTATLSALLTARERSTDFRINSTGFSGEENFRVYSSAHVHSSIDKALKISGIGVENLVRIAVDENFAMIPEELEKAILRDKENGFVPLMVISALGTTSSTAVDPIGAITEISQRQDIWHHIDAAFAGTALLLDEFKPLMKGHEGADSYVFNPHKWMMTNFDCTIMYLKEPKALVETFGLTPEYLKTEQDEQVNNYRDWGIPLGRRFRALKLWFVIRSYGLEGLRKKIQGHLDLAREAESWILAEPNLEVLAPVNFNTICFRYVSSEMSETSLNQINSDWMSAVNTTRKAFFTHTKLDRKYVIRWVIGQTDVEKKHIQQAWVLLKQKLSETLKNQA